MRDTLSSPSPHDDALERSVIASVLLSTNPVADYASASAIVAGDDFYVDSNRAVWKAIGAALMSLEAVIANDAMPGATMLRIDAVDGALRAANNSGVADLQTLNGFTAGDCVPELERAARAIRGFALRRHPDAGAAFKRTAPLDQPAAPPVYSLADVARTRLYLGPPVATGFEKLDWATRGGLRRGSWIVIGGSPDAGKTTLGINIGMHHAAAGGLVGFLAIDEDMARVVERVGQARGFDRDELGADDPTARDELASQLDGLSNVMLFDGEDHTVESAAAALIERAQGRTCMLMVDSIQTARSEFLAGDETDKVRVDRTVKACKRAAARGLIVLAISELNRSAYANADPTKRVDDLASFKESGSVEYGAPVAFVMRSVKGTPDEVDITFAKNKLRGPDVPAGYCFRLRLDRPRATFHAAEMPAPVDREAQTAAAAVARFDRFKSRALDLVREHRDITSKNQLVSMFEGDRNLKLAAVRELIDARRLVIVGSAFRVGPGSAQ